MTMVCRLQIPTNEQNIAPVCDFTTSWCLNHGLSKVESIRFTVAVSELVTDIILFAYPENSRENFEIEYHYSFPNLEIVVSELGEPFDPDKHTYDAKKAREESNFEGAGLLLMKELSDEFSFINKGKEGKEFRLSKKIEIHDIDELLQQSASLREPEVDRDQQENPHKNIDEFTVSRIRSADAEEIAKIFYRTYEYSYFKEDMYLPKKIEEAVLSKEKLGVIARKEDGEAIGYFGVMQKEDSDIAELGEAIVTPSYRRNGVMTSMMNHLIEILKDQGVTALFAKAVTNHLVSQKVNHKFGYETTAILLALSENIKYKGFDEDYPQPISAALEFLPLIYPKQKSVYLP
ncbi:MAG: GNAT family N-acetyltransferase, partial [Rhodohalobacter sp.]